MTATKKVLSGVAALAAFMMLQSPSFATDAASIADAPAEAADSTPLFSGGVAEEMDYIKSVEHQYDLKLLLTETDGAFLADLPVSIRNTKGETVVSTVTKGPVLLVNLPAGSYVVSATDAGVTKEQKVTVAPKALRTYHFVFATQPGEVE